MADYKSTHTGEQIDTAIDNANSNWSLLMANLGIGRWANQEFKLFAWKTNTRIIYDDLLPYYSDYTRMFQSWNYTGATTDIYFDKDFAPNKNMNFLFLNAQATGTIYLPNCLTTRSTKWNYYQAQMFKSAQFSKILVKDGCTFKLTSALYETFANNSNLKEIGAFDCSLVTDFIDCFTGASNIKSIHFNHIKCSMNISVSTQFEEADLVEIISNLDEVTTTQTLTMGATNLAKLTDAEKQVATDKGWVLA